MTKTECATGALHPAYVEYPSVKAASNDVTIVMILRLSFSVRPASLMKKYAALALMSAVKSCLASLRPRRNGQSPPLIRR